MPISLLCITLPVSKNSKQVDMIKFKVNAQTSHNILILYQSCICVPFPSPAERVEQRHSEASSWLVFGVGHALN